VHSIVFLFWGNNQEKWSDHGQRNVQVMTVYLYTMHLAMVYIAIKAIKDVTITVEYTYQLSTCVSHLVQYCQLNLSPVCTGCRIQQPDYLKLRKCCKREGASQFVGPAVCSRKKLPRCSSS